MRFELFYRVLFLLEGQNRVDPEYVQDLNVSDVLCLKVLRLASCCADGRFLQ
jgi:hypothetical protein